MAWGRRRWIKFADLQPGLRVLQNIYGARGQILIFHGEVLSGLHITKIKKWDAPDQGWGRLRNHQPRWDEVEVQTALGSPREYPICEENPELAESIRRYKSNG